MTAWDLWCYRNGRLHKANEPKELAQHATIDALIHEDFNLGYANMSPDSRHLIQNTTIGTIKQYTIVDKNLWLELVRIGQKSFTNVHGTPPSLARQSQMLRNWLGA